MLQESSMKPSMKLLYSDEYDPKKFIAESDEYILVRGGDGTLLRAINMYGFKKKPFYGIAGGSMNFLMNDTESPVPSPKHKVKFFNRIKVQVEYQKWERDMSALDDILKPKSVTFQAFNDICIGGSDGMNAWIDFNIEEKDELFGNFKGGGLIIATPQGSTGINKTNGGSILPLSSALWSVEGDKTTKRISYVIKPRYTVITPTSRKSVMVWIDGANDILDNVTKVTVSKGDEIKVIFNDYSEFKKKRRAI